MQALLAATPVEAWWKGLLLWAQAVVVVSLFLLIFLLIFGYKVRKGARITGFGPHAVKTMTTDEYDYDDPNSDAPEPGRKAQPKKQTITTEEQASRTIWDWMTVLTISAMIAFVALLFTSHQAEQQRYIQEQEAMEASLQTYLDQMTDMMLDDKPLLKSKPNSAPRVIARVRTLTALKRLDSKRNKVVVSFLKESGLLMYRVPGDPKEGVVKLDDADLSGVELAGANLSGVNLRFVDLRGAHLQNARLGAANLAYADLTDAKLEEANLRDADLLFANLRGADLKGADFTGAHLAGANVEGALNPSSATNLPSQDRIDGMSEVDSVDMLGASLAPLESVKPDMGKIGIPGGVGRTNENEDKNEDIYGTLVSAVTPESPAEAIGFQSGDLLLKVEGDKVQDVEDLKEKLEQHKDSKKVSFTIKRRYFNKGWRKVHLDGKLEQQGTAT